MHVFNAYIGARARYFATFLACKASNKSVERIADMNRLTMRTGLMALLTLLLVACGGGQKKELNRLLLDVADKDELVDAQEWEQIAEFLDGQKMHFK